MVWLYILENYQGKHYVGITAKDLAERLSRHNRGEVSSTKHHRPWELVYSETYKDYNSARIREIQIKGWHGGNAFKKLVSKAAGSSNGRTADSESVYLGSNPSPAALLARTVSGSAAPIRSFMRRRESLSHTVDKAIEGCKLSSELPSMVM